MAGFLSSMSNWPWPIAADGVEWPAVSVATTTKLTGVSLPAIWTEPGTLKEYVLTSPVSPVLPATSCCPVICSAADMMPGPPVPSTTAVTVNVCERVDHVVGAVTVFTPGPCATQTALRQDSLALQICVHPPGMAQRFCDTSHLVLAGQSESVEHEYFGLVHASTAAAAKRRIE
jgi:hypothetical protein